MPIVNHVPYSIDSNLETIIIHNDGTPLYGEIEMFKRIYLDCEASGLTWHFWHDLRLPIHVKGQSSIQIDFLLVCEEGAVIVEVKGGKVGVDKGLYYLEKNREKTYLQRTPFEQADDYMYALISNKIISKSQMFICTACAFPHTSMTHTSLNPNMDLGYKLWSANQHKDTTQSFADFALGILKRGKINSSWSMPPFQSDEIETTIRSLLFTFEDRRTNIYSESEMQVILERLKIDNLSSFESLQKNDRLFIEGGPGTGKTTIAKAYVEKYRTLRGLYLCWNKLLHAKIKHELSANGLVNCRVEQFASYIFQLKNQYKIDIPIELNDLNPNDGQEKVGTILQTVRKNKEFIPYDYIIIDEAQDILDKGAVHIVNSLSSVKNNGISTGRYLMFYDTEQGYNNQGRHVEDIVDSIAQNGARFVLDTNKRVPTNKEIVSFANNLLEGMSPDSLLELIIKDNYDSVKVEYFDSTKLLIKHLNSIKSQIREGRREWNDYVILADSSFKRKNGDDEPLFDRIADIDGIKEVTVDNICVDTGELPLSSILSYKGLESKHVILVLNNKSSIDPFELYVGMTRAIIDLRILVLN